MIAQCFYELLDNPETIQSSDLPLLITIDKNYPWFALNRLLILKCKQKIKSNDYSQYILFAALSVDNGDLSEWLKD